MTNFGRYRSFFLGALSVLSVLVAWQVSAMLQLLPVRDFPTVGHVLQRVYELRLELALELYHTLRRAGIGLLLAIVIMIPLGALIGRSRALSLIVEPIIEVLRPLPTPAIIPLVMLIAGIGDTAKIAVIFYAAAFPILLNAIDGARGLHPALSLTARSLRLTRFEAIVFVFIPATFPQVMAGVRTSVAISILVSVTSEMLLSTDGLGIFLLRSQENFRLADGLAGILVLATAAFLINRVCLSVDQRLLMWHHQTVGDRSSVN